jgi:hypothetical protein
MRACAAFLRTSGSIDVIFFCGSLIRNTRHGSSNPCTVVTLIRILIAGIYSPVLRPIRANGIATLSMLSMTAKASRPAWDRFRSVQLERWYAIEELGHPTRQ